MNLFISVIAALILFACMGYVFILMFRQYIIYVKTNEMHEKENEILRLRVAQLSEPVSQLKNKLNEAAWNGYRKFILKGKVLESEDICSFYFIPHDKKSLPPFIPGQHLTFRVNLPERSKPVVRCYSLSDSPNHPDYYRVTIKRIAPSKNKPNGRIGLLSNNFYKDLQAGNIVDIKAPSGHFYLDTHHINPIVLISGGIGVTPMLSMINYLVATGAKREVWFFYTVKNSTKHIMMEYLNDIGKNNPNIHIHICYSRPLDTDILHKHYNHKERVSVELLKKVLPSNNFVYYICGPAPMMEAITRDLREWDVPDDKINFEAFGPSTVRRLVPEEITKRAHIAGVAIKFAKSGISLNWNGLSPSLLDFAENADITIDSGCRSGSCGSCKIAIRSGEVEYITPPGISIDPGTCLACIAIPKTELIIDA